MWELVTGAIRAATARLVRSRSRASLSLAVVLVLAVAIGINTVVFSLVNGLLLRALPFVAPDRIVTLSAPAPSAVPGDLVAGPLFQSWRAETQAFERIAGFMSRSAIVEREGTFRRVDLTEASPALFAVLSVRPLVGQAFRSEDEVRGRGCVAMVHEAFWTSVLHRADPASEPKIVVDGQPCRVIGVMPAAFAFPDARTQLWLPLDPRTTIEPGGDGRPRVSTKSFPVIARLANVATADQALAETRRATKQPDVRLMTLKERNVGPVRPVLLLVQCVAGLVLLIACANLAGLLLADGLTRERELALQAAVGARPSRLLAERLLEVGLLAIIGGLVGLALAAGALSVVKSAVTATLPQLTQVTLDWRTLLFAALVSIVSGLAAGLLPALRAYNVDVGRVGELQHRSGSQLAGRSRLSRLLVVMEVALTFALLVAATSLVMSLLRAVSTDLGYHVDRVATMELTFPAGRYDSFNARRQAIDEILERLKALPGGRQAAVASSLPLASPQGYFRLDEPPPAPGEVFFRQETMLRYAVVSEDYFEVLRIQLRQGRSFTVRDDAGSPPAVIVSEAIARREFGSTSPLGQRLEKFLGRDWEVVGVAGDIKDGPVGDAASPMVYIPYRQLSRPEDQSPRRFRTVHLVVHTVGEPSRESGALTQAVAHVDPNLIPRSTSSLRARLAGTLAQTNLYAALFAVFALTALTLASIGLFALLMHGVTTHRREIGVRMALGAAPRLVLKRVVQEGVLLTMGGLTVGVPLGLVVQRVLNASVPNVMPEWAAFVAAPLILLVIALTASALPAVRAMRVDPLISLRQE